MFMEGSRKTEEHVQERRLPMNKDGRQYDDLHNTWQTLSVEQTFERVTPLDPLTPVSEDRVRFVCISDTHNRIETKPSLIPPGDVLLHSGDITLTGFPAGLELFNNFLGILPHQVKIVIAGNHDVTLDKYSVENRRTYLEEKFGITKAHFEDVLEEKKVESSKELLTNCVLLEDQSVTVCGIKIYGAPWIPESCHMGFNIPRGSAILEKWNLIPSDTDILMTHGPPLGRGDLCISNKRVGCLDLLHTIQQRVKPKYHVFGHIHEGYGVSTDGTTTFINASFCTVRYQPRQMPIVFDFPLPKGHSKKELNSLAFDLCEPWQDKAKSRKCNMI